jgi:hypothetical protein
MIGWLRERKDEPPALMQKMPRPAWAVEQAPPWTIFSSAVIVQVAPPSVERATSLRTPAAQPVFWLLYSW